MKTSRSIQLRNLLFASILAVLLIYTGLALAQEEPLQVTLDLGTRWSENYRWDISKEVHPVSADASMGETVTFLYDISLNEVFDKYEYWLYGTVFIYNPTDTPREFTISAVIGGSVNVVLGLCRDHFGADSWIVLPNSTSECYFDTRDLTGPLYQGQEVLVSVTTTGASPQTFTASGVVEWPSEPRISGVWPTLVNVVGDAQDPFVDGYWEQRPVGTFIQYAQNYTCPTDESLYQNGQYTVSIGNTASITESTFSDSVAVTINCFTTEVEECTYGHGYWASHSEHGPAPYDDAWLNISSIGSDTIFFRSGQTYYEVLNTAPAGNPYYQLARAYIAAKLNILNGVTPDQDAIFAIAFGDEIFYTYGPTDAMPSHIPGLMREFAATLETFNSSSSCSQP